MYWVVKTRKIRHRLLDIQFQLLVFLFQNVGLSLIVVAFGKCMLAFQKKCLIIFFAVVLLLPGNSYGKTWVMTKLLGLYHNVAKVENWKNPGGRFGATSLTALPIWPNYQEIRQNGLNWLFCLAGSSKVAPRILIFSRATVAKPLFYMKFIAT